jgi:hypothetical protein
LSTDRPHIRLQLEGKTLEVRVVRRGDAYGTRGRQIHRDYASLVEFVEPHVTGDVFVAAIPSDTLRDHVHHTLAIGSGHVLQRRDIEQLQAWLDDPYDSSFQSFTALVVGDGEDARVAAVALRHLQLQPVRAEIAPRAIAELRLDKPQVIVVADDAVSHAKEIAAAARGVPMIVIGNGADATLPSPVDHRRLEAMVAEMLELV